jgi:hypothetical protein
MTDDDDPQLPRYDPLLDHLIAVAKTTGESVAVARTSFINLYVCIYAPLVNLK